MGDHARPLHTYEETIHIPLIFSQPGRIPAGRVFEGRTCNYDFFPSVLDYLELQEQIADNPNLPGTSYSPALTGEEITWNTEIFHEFENTRLVRNDRWKYTWRHPDGPDELYDMQADPGEGNNLANRSHATVINECRNRIQNFFNQYADPQYDLWRGGRSKAGRIG